MITEQHIFITSKMIEARDTMKRFFGKDYEKRKAPFVDALLRWRTETGLPMLKVGLGMMKIVEEHGSDIEMALAIAAIVDAIEAEGNPACST